MAWKSIDETRRGLIRSMDIDLNPETGISTYGSGPLEGLQFDKAAGTRLYNIEQNLFTRKLSGSMSQGILGTGASPGFVRRSLAGAVTGGGRATSFLRQRFLQQSGFKSVTQAMGKAWQHKWGVGAGAGLGMLIGAGIEGDFSIGSLAHHAKEGAVMDLSWRMAAPANAGFIKGMLNPATLGWTVAGGAMGLSTTQTLGLQAAAYMVGGKGMVAGIGSAMFWPLAVGGAAYYGGKAIHQGLASLAKSGQESRRPNWGTGDMSFATANAATMRARAMEQIQNSHLNARALLGNEATAYARAVGY